MHSANVASLRPARLVAALVAFALLLAGLLFGAATAHADDTAGIGGGPSDGAGTDRRTAFLYQIDPGQHIEDYYYVKNSGTIPQDVIVFATDAYTADDGSYAFLDTDEEPVDAGTWVTFADGSTRLQFTLGPGELRVLPFFVDVPANAGPGDHAGGIVVAARSTGGQVLVERRVATRMYVRVEGELQAALAISRLDASYEQQLNPFDGGVMIHVTFENVGNIAVSADVVAGVKAVFGIPVKANEVVHLDQLLPGDTRIVSYPVSGVAQLGLLVPYVDAVPIVTDQLPLPPGTAVQLYRETIIPAVPWWLVIVLGVGAIVVVIVVWRRRVDLRRAKEWIEWTEAEANRRADETPPSVGAGSERSR